jgi:ssDNA-binding Zn-finger/Zn-ribbon topoisomerase 1
MPFIADQGGEVVVPEEVPDDAHLTCLDCGDELRVRQTHERDGTFVARHFWHVGGDDGCLGGESETHRRLKSIVLSKLKHTFRYTEAGIEKKIGRNIADVYAVFDNQIGRFGEGVVVEVQYRNEGKDVVSVTRNYLEEGFSTCWIEDTEIDGKDVDLSDPKWFYVERREDYEHNEFLQMRYELDPETGKPIPPLYCPDCYGKIKLKKIDKENPRGSGKLYGCSQCAEIFVNSYYGPVIPRDYYGDRVIEEDFYKIEGPPKSASSPELTCPDCLANAQLQEAHGISHAYKNGAVYECPLCGGYFLESGDIWSDQSSVERVVHNGNLNHESDRF